MLFGDHLGLFVVKEHGAILVLVGFWAENVFYNKYCKIVLIFLKGTDSEKHLHFWSACDGYVCQL